MYSEGYSCQPYHFFHYVCPNYAGTIMNGNDPLKMLRSTFSFDRNLRLTKLLLRLMRLNRLNDLMTSSANKKGHDFIDSLFKELEISFEVSEEDKSRIPKTGPFIVVANHPFGGLDDLILLRIFSGIRPDFKIFSNPILQKFGGLDEFVLPGTAFSSSGRHRSTPGQIMGVVRHLQSGSPIGIFPSGKVSGYDLNSNDITDKQWGTNALRFIRNAKVPVIPVYFKGSNSLFFQLLGMIHPSLQTFKLPSELLNKKNSSIELRIGKPITVKDQEEFQDISRYGRYLRAKTYALGTSLEVRRFFTTVDEHLPEAEEIVPPMPVHLLEAEVRSLEENNLLFETTPFKVYCAPASMIPNIILEIGRLREETFRLVGEGTNKKIDLDEYDIYYRHLFVWDEEASRIVGAYRLGMGNEIVEEYGINGFYIYSLYKISEGFRPVMGSAIELGRSFIVPDYQKKPLSLFSLWKGILYFLLKHRECRYLIGPVSISNRFSKFSRSLMIEYITQHYFDYHYSQFVKPRNEFISDTGNIDVEILLEEAKDLSKFDKCIRDVDFEDAGMPVLLKKYLGLNGKIVAFNVDQNFNDALDGLLVLDVMEVPTQVITNLSKELEDSSIIERFSEEQNSVHRK
ncbi:MAG: lysophospholipid acyltransferase family protein [Bacteroidetes bacterium]|nr:lysophospholipid acyltransferase family protein [Bacteroidota bacterium]